MLLLIRFVRVQNTLRVDPSEHATANVERWFFAASQLQNGCWSTPVDIPHRRVPHKKNAKERRAYTTVVLTPETPNIICIYTLSAPGDAKTDDRNRSYLHNWFSAT